MGIGADLAAQYPSFDEDLRTMEKVLSSLSKPPSWSLRGQSHIILSILILTHTS